MNLNLTTFLNQLGFGVFGLNVLKGLVGRGHDVALFPTGPGQAPREDQDLVGRAVGRARRFDADAPSLRIDHPWNLAHHVGRGPKVGFSFFELDRLTEQEAHNHASLDYAFVPTGWAGRVLMEAGVPDDKICYAPPGVDASIFHAGVEPAWDKFYSRVRQKNTTVFLNCGKWEVRKGHDVLHEAFRGAFGPEDNVLLVMNCCNPFLPPAEQERWEKMYAGLLGDQVAVIPSRLPRQQDVAALMAVADCGVFPARAEGWNLELAEMMAMGKVAIATNYSGHTEFCTRENCLLIEPGPPEPAFDGVFFDGKKGNWSSFGDRQVDELIGHLRLVHRLKQDGRLATNEAGVETFRHFTWDNCVDEIMSVL